MLKWSLQLILFCPKLFYMLLKITEILFCLFEGKYVGMLSGWLIMCHPVLGQLSRIFSSKQCFKRTFVPEKQIFSKNAHICLDFKEAKLSPSWMVLMAEVWEHNEIFCFLFHDILTKYFIVLSNLSRQHHSAETQFGFFEIKTNQTFWMSGPNIAKIVLTLCCFAPPKVYAES